MSEIIIKKIHRSRRRTLALEINTQAELIIRAPFLISEQRIFDFVNLKREWIMVKQKQILDRIGKIKKREFVDGEEIMFLGKAYPLKITKGKKIELSDFLEFPAKFLRLPEKHLEKWYRACAKEIITKRCAYFSENFGLRYASIKINGAKKRLGSCSARQSLNFSWYMMRIPQEVIDYVIIHELCHLEVKNHSKRFWNKVETRYPTYKEQKRWLRKNYSALR